MLSGKYNFSSPFFLPVEFFSIFFFTIFPFIDLFFLHRAFLFFFFPFLSPPHPSERKISNDDTALQTT